MTVFGWLLVLMAVRQLAELLAFEVREWKRRRLFKSWIARKAES